MAVQISTDAGSSQQQQNSPNAMPDTPRIDQQASAARSQRTGLLHTIRNVANIRARNVTTASVQASLKLQSNHLIATNKIHRELKLMRRELTWIRMAINPNPPNINLSSESEESENEESDESEN